MGLRKRDMAGKKTAILEFLGSGTSTGVPVAGCNCEVCRSTDPHDKRLRTCVRIQRGERNLIVDTTPEFRIQCLRAGIRRVDAVLITHEHADHLNGFDDVRSFSSFRRRTLPVYCSGQVAKVIHRRFDYIWNAVQVGGGLPDIELREVTGPFSVLGMEVIPVPIKHGKIDILGYRFGDTAYLTDVSDVPESSLPLLTDLGNLIVTCVRKKRHPTHLNVAGVKRLHNLLKPRRTLLTHLSHHLFHRELIGLFPADVIPVYDGMRIEATL